VEVYRRRRAGVIAGLALAALAIIALLVVLSGGGDDKATITVPDVVGRTQAEASRILTDAGLKVVVTQRDSPVPTDQVSDQDPDAGKLVSRDSTVTIFIARPTPTTTAPATTQATATTAPATTRETTATTGGPGTTAPATTQATTATTQAPATTAAPTTAAPTTSIVIPTSLVLPTSRP
jgi:beta-lactam-binding protein with PASTA domain